MCLFEQDREEVKRFLSENGILHYKVNIDAIDLDLENLDLSRAEPLTPAEQSECRATGHIPIQEEEDDDDDDKE